MITFIVTLTEIHGTRFSMFKEVHWLAFDRAKTVNLPVAIDFLLLSIAGILPLFSSAALWQRALSI